MFNKLKTLTKEKIKHSPFIIAGLIGFMDLSGGALSAIADIVWLVFDTAIKTDELMHYPLVYGGILISLIIAALILLSGAILTVFVIVKFANDGHLHKEIHTELEHKQEELRQAKRNKIFKSKN